MGHEGLQFHKNRMLRPPAQANSFLHGCTCIFDFQGKKGKGERKKGCGSGESLSIRTAFSLSPPTHINCELVQSSIVIWAQAWTRLHPFNTPDHEEVTPADDPISKRSYPKSKFPVFPPSSLWPPSPTRRATHHTCKEL